MWEVSDIIITIIIIVMVAEGLWYYYCFCGINESCRRDDIFIVLAAEMRWDDIVVAVEWLVYGSCVLQ